MNKKIEDSVREGIKKISPYVPGKPSAQLLREHSVGRVIKLASNENAFGPSPKAVEAVKRSAEDISRYPEGSGYCMKQAISEAMDVGFENIILGSGSSEVISMAMETFLNPGDEVIYPSPSFIIYKILAYKTGAVNVEVPLKDDFSYNLDSFLEKINARTKVIILCSPNNPTGTIVYKKQLEDFLSRVPDNVLVISDEAYREYVESEDFGSALPYINRGNVLVTGTFSKMYALAGLRIGWGFADCRLLGYMERIRPPFNTTSPAQEAAIASLKDTVHVADCRRYNIEGKNYLYSELAKLEIESIRSEANFILCRFKEDAGPVVQELEKRGIIIRGMKAFGLPSEYARVTVGTPEENRLLVENLHNIML